MKKSEIEHRFKSIARSEKETAEREAWVGRVKHPIHCPGKTAHSVVSQ